MINHPMAKNIAYGLIIGGIATNIIGGNLLGDTLEIWSYNTSTGIDPFEWHKAEYRATFMPAVLTALGYMCFGVGLIILGASRDKLDISGIVSMAAGVILFLGSLVIILQRFVMISSL